MTNVQTDVFGEGVGYPMPIDIGAFEQRSDLETVRRDHANDEDGVRRDDPAR